MQSSYQNQEEVTLTQEVNQQTQVPLGLPSSVSVVAVTATVHSYTPTGPLPSPVSASLISFTSGEDLSELAEPWRGVVEQILTLLDIARVTAVPWGLEVSVLGKTAGWRLLDRQIAWLMAVAIDPEMRPPLQFSLSEVPQAGSKPNVAVFGPFAPTAAAIRRGRKDPEVRVRYSLLAGAQAVQPAHRSIRGSSSE